MSADVHTVSPSHRLAALDGVRGVAVLAVVALHAGLASWGWIGVDIFFVLSGFLITGILLDAKPAAIGGWEGYGKPFYMRRVLRIVPLAWAFLAALFLLAPALGLTPSVPFGEQVWYWGFLSNGWLGFRSRTAWMAGHFWSLAVEEQFYLVWPWLILATPRARLGRVLKSLLAVAPLARLAIVLLHLPPQIGHVYENLTLTRMDGLLAGALVALLARESGGLARHRRGSMIWLTTCGTLFGLLHLYAPTKQIGYLLRYPAIAGFAASGLLLLVSSPAGRGSRLLGARWLAWLGTRSYGIYVIHLPVVMWLAARGLAPWLVFVAGSSVTMALAAVSWVALERPFLSMKSRWKMAGALRQQLTFPAPRP